MVSRSVTLLTVSWLISLLVFVTGFASAQDILGGRLGFPLGTYLKIEGARAEGFKTGVNTLMVDTVNDTKLDRPEGIWVENVDSLPKGTRCVLRGYETGSMIGVPPAVIEAAKEEGKTVNVPQAAWQFRRFFIVTSVVQPKELMKK